jgi:hypothetical protein
VGQQVVFGRTTGLQNGEEGDARHHFAAASTTRPSSPTNTFTISNGSGTAKVEASAGIVSSWQWWEAF